MWCVVITEFYLVFYTKMDRFEYTSSKLATDERSIVRMNGVKLYDGDIKVCYILFYSMLGYIFKMFNSGYFGPGISVTKRC